MRVIALTLLSMSTPRISKGSADNKALGRAEVKYQWNGCVPHSELLHQI